MYELDYSISKPLSKVRDCLLEGIISYLEDHNNITVTKHKRTLISNALGCFLLNSYKMYIREVDRVYLTLDESNYSNKLIVNGRVVDRKVSYTYTKQVLNYLKKEEYIDLNIGGVVEYGMDYRKETKAKFKPVKTQASYATMNLKLTTFLKEVSCDNIPYRTNVLHLRDKNKRPLPFRVTGNAQLQSAKDYLQRFNRFSMGFEVMDIDGVLYDVQMYKIYNIILKYGGRSFMSGSIQSLSSEERKGLKIDGKATTSYDYVSFEPSLAYSIKQEVMEGDAYDITLEGYDNGTLREVAKRALMMMFNCKSKSGAKKALNSYIKRNMDVVELHKQGKIPSDWIHTDLILNRLEAKHQKISDMMYNESSFTLQQVGSLVNDYVVDSLMQKHGCLVLQVHDSFIVQEEFGDILKETMVKGYEHIFGYSDNCYIELEF